MKKISVLVMSAVVLVSSSAFAEGITRAEVQRQLVTAEQNGSRLVTDASYPDVARIYTGQVPQRTDGTETYGSIASRKSAVSGSIPNVGTASHEACVGPRTFCDTYAGS